MPKTNFISKTGAMALAFAMALGSVNCSGKTYSTFLQPFDLVFGGSKTTANSSVSVSLLAATPLTNTRVMLTFNKPVSLGSSQLTGNYRITDSNGNLLNILAVSRDPNNSNIVFVDTIPQASGSQYTVTASNIVGVDGASLGSSNSATFTAPNNADQTGPLFSSVSVTTSTTLDVFFDEALDATTSATAANYRFYTGASAAAAVAACQADGTFSAGTAATGSVRDSANFARVTLTRSAMTTGTIYAIGARNVRDIWGNAVANTTCSVGFLYTASTPRVVSAVSSSPTSVLVTFDQAMSNAIQPTPAVNSTPLTTRANYTFTNCGTLSASAATFSVVSSTQILLSGLVTGTAGTCTLTLNTAITSAAGVALTAATNSVVFGYAVADTTAPSVASVTATNSNTVRVTFNEPINDATVSSSDFNFSPALTVTGVVCQTGAGNYTYCDVTTSTDQTTQSYTVTVSGINDVAGNALSTSTTTFTGDGKPYIVAYYPVDSGTVLVEWSEPIGNSASVGAADYSLATATITGAALYLPDANDRSKFVKLTISPVLTSGTTYTLSVNNPTGSVDATGNGTLGTVPGGGTFTGPTATTAPQVTSASSSSPTTVIVNFNEPLNNSTIAATDFGIVGAGCATVVTGVTQIQAGVVQLVLTSVASNGPSCTVTVGAGNVADLAGNTIAATNNSATYSYTGTGTADTTAPTIGSVIALSNTQVRVYFSEPVTTGGGANAGDNTANYAFSPALTGGVASASCTSTYCTLTLNAPGTSAVQYGLTVSNVQDAAANTMSSQTVNFSGIGSSVTAPTLYMATLINSTTVELSFSEIMDLTTAQSTANYSVTGGNTVSAAVRQADATKVRLTITPGAYGSSNSYTVTGGAGLTDASGNALGTPNSATFSGSATAPATTDLAAGSDLGSSNTDNITSAAFPTPGLQFTGTVAANTTVMLYYSPTVTFTDAGDLVTLNSHGYSNGQTVTFSSISSTTGISSNVTYYVISATANTFQLSTTPGGAAIPLTTNGSGVLNTTIPLGTGVSAADGSYSITVTSGTNIAQGTNVFSVATVGPTGLVSDVSPGLTVTYDTTADAAPTALDLIAGNDSGISTTDNITNNATPSFTVSCVNGSTVVLRDGTTNITNPATGVTCSGGTATIVASTLAAGTYASINVVQTDTAGNTSSASTNLSPSLVIDTAAPVIAATSLVTNSYMDFNFAPDAVYNSATSSGTALTAAAFGIVFNNGGSGTTATIGCVTNTASTSCPGTAPAVGATAVRVILNTTGTFTGVETVTISSVANSIYDSAGNAATVTSGSKNFTAIGTATISGTPTYTSTGATTGYISVSWSEGVYTLNNNTGALVAADFTRAFTANGGNATDAVVTCVTDAASTSCPGTAPAAGATSIRLQITTTGATSGVETIQVNAATNEIFAFGGNATPNTANTGLITFPDKLAPNAPAALALASADDTGASNSDRITSNTTNLTISGTAEANSTVRLYQPNSAGTLLATLTADGSGNWSGDITLAAGSTYTVVATARDAALNVSSDSTGLSITIDTSAPAAPGTPDMTAGTDTGSSSTDNLTNNQTPSFTVSCENGASVQLRDTATATGTAGTCAGGTVTLTAGTLGGGAHSINAIQTDAAGNVSTASGNLAVTIDVTADAATGTPDLTAGTDTGSSSTDDITNNATPSFTVSCVTGSSVQLYDGASATGAAGTCAAGTVTLTAATLGSGAHNINAIQTDPAGNASTASSNLSVTIDTTADAAPGTPDMTAGTDSGSSSTDDITSNTTPSFTVSCVTGSSVQLRDNVTATGSAVTCAAGSATLTSAALSAGAHNINAIQTDTAGNVSSASSNLAVTIDTGNPAAPAALALAAADDTGTSNSDRITKNTSALTISGTAEANATVRLYQPNSSGTLLATLTADGAGNWSGDISLAEGSYTVVATARDAAGNTGVDSAGLSITVDTTAPTNQDTVYAASSTRAGGGSVTIVSSGVASNEVWFAPSGTTIFTAGATMTKAASGTSTSILAPATAGSYKLFVLDAAGNISSESTATLTVDNTAPTISSVAPATNAYVKDTVVSYTFSEAVASGSVVWTRTGGTADGSSPHTANLTGGELATGAHSSITLTNAPTLVSGTIYTVTFSATDAAGNAATAVSSTNVTYDTTLPVISAVSPATNANVNSTSVSYTLSEVCQTGSITWTRTGGTADVSSPHTRALTGSELNAGTFTGNITNNPTLVDGTIYSVAFNCTDRAGNVGTTVTSTNVTYSPGVLAITTADTMDTDNDGKIDTYRVSFNKPVNDSTFPGYSANALGSVTANWLVAGYTNVRLLHGTAVTFATDTANDAVIYIRFDENVQTCSSASQVGCDTEAKPDLTTTATPGLQDLTAATIAQVTTGSVTESDQAKPVLIAARSLSTTTADAIFSETVETTTAQTATNYVITGGSNPTVTTATRDTTNTNIVHLVTGTQTGGQAYVLTVNTNVKDNANLSMNSSANTANFTGVQNPVVSSVVTTSATTLTITFNESVTAASTECSTTTACAAIFDNTSIPILSAVSTAGAGNNAATYTLTVNPMVEGQAYTVTVLQNTVTSVATGNKMLNTNNSATFNGDGKPGASISTDTATACPANGPAKRVVVQYDQTVSATATTITNYKITGCISGASCSTGTGAPNSAGAATVTAQGGNKYAVDFTNNFATDATLYQLTISGVQDSNGNTIAAPGNFSFQCGTDTTPPSLVSASVVTATAGSTVVLLTFSEGVDNVTGNTSTNYKYDSAAYGSGVLSAARQANTAEILVTFQPALSNGGHQIRVQNVADLKTPTGNTIVDNGTTNVQPIIVNAPTGFTGGPIFNDPFGDGTTAGTIVVYDNKLYLGADSAASKLFEMNYSLTAAQTITLDADGTFGAPTNTYSGYLTKYSGCASVTVSNPPLPAEQCSTQFAVSGIDTLYAACIGGTSTPRMTGSTCTGAGGTEKMFIGALNTMGLYRSFWETTTKSSSSTTFPYTERYAGDAGGTAAYRSANLVLFKDQLFVNFGAELGGGGRGGRVCMNPAGCTGADNATYLSYTSLSSVSRMKRIGASNSNSLRNGSYNGAGAPYADASVSNQAYNAISLMYEHDNDGTGANESQLYVANGGYTNSTLGSARTGNSDGGIMRTILARSTKTSLPLDCPNDSSGCTSYWEDVTPDGQTKWNSYISIPWPQNTAITGSGNCSTSSIEMDCTLPYNLFIPALKAIPYMRTAPNGDLYMLRNACSTNSFATNGGTNNFRTLRQVCPSGSEVPQLWMMPKNCGTAANCAAAGTGWRLVAEYGSTGKTNMGSNTGSCGTAPNKCLANTHVTLLEFVGNYLYIGWDNATYGANVWRTDMTSVASGSIPAETAFSIVNLPGIETASGGTNQKLFSHVTVNDSGKDWLIIITRDGSSAMKIYRTANDQN